MADWIVSHFPEHVAYVETCVGGGAVFWAKPRADSTAEIINDADGELVNFYRQLHRRGRSMAREVDGMPYSRGLFNSMRDGRPMGQYARAVRFWYLNRVRFGATQRGCSFGPHAARRSHVLTARILGELDQVIERLRGVTIENLDAARLIALYDRPTTVFFVDPPYVGVEGLYAEDFQPADHGRLADALLAAKGTWFLTYNDCPVIRELYPSACIRPFTVRYSSANVRLCPRKLGAELLLSNRPSGARIAPAHRK